MDMPILADIGGAIFGIVIVLISIASAISNIAKEKNKPQPGKMKEKASLQKELEKFLQEAVNPQQKKNVKAAEVNLFEEDDLEFEAPPVQQPPQRRRRQQQTRQTAQRTQSGQAKQSTTTPTRVTQNKTPTRHSERAEIEAKERQQRLGGSLRNRIQEKHETHVQTRINSEIGGNVSQHLSETFGSLKNRTETQKSKLGESKVIRRLMKDPTSIRQAIILNEVLSPPKALRRS